MSRHDTDIIVGIDGGHLAIRPYKKMCESDIKFLMQRLESRWVTAWPDYESVTREEEERRTEEKEVSFRTKKTVLVSLWGAGQEEDRSRQQCRVRHRPPARLRRRRPTTRTSSTTPMTTASRRVEPAHSSEASPDRHRPPSTQHHPHHHRSSPSPPLPTGKPDSNFVCVWLLGWK